MLSGRAMDRHFRAAPLPHNLPVLLALTGIWHRNICGYPGRAILRLVATGQAGDGLEIVAINDIGDPKSLRYLLRFDTVMGRFPGDAQYDKAARVMNDHHIGALVVTDDHQVLTTPTFEEFRA